MMRDKRIRSNLDWAGEFRTMAERMMLSDSEEHMFRQLQKFKEDFNTEYGKLSRAERKKHGFREFE